MLSQISVYIANDFIYYLEETFYGDVQGLFTYHISLFLAPFR